MRSSPLVASVVLLCVTVFAGACQRKAGARSEAREPGAVAPAGAEGPAGATTRSAGIFGFIASPETIRGRHSIHLWDYDVALALPDAVVLQRRDDLPSVCAWEDAQRRAFMFVTAPWVVSTDAEPQPPSALARRVAEEFGAPPSIVGDGSPLLCSSEIQGFEWELVHQDGTIWVAVIEREDADAEPGDYRWYRGLIVMGGPHGSPFARGGDAQVKVRASLRASASYDHDVSLDVDSCARSQVVHAQLDGGASVARADATVRRDG